MSADRWSICPRCTRRLEADVAKQQAELDASYGEVPLDEFDALRAAVDASRLKLETASQDRHTFREDWEFYGLDEGFVTADYRGGCKECGLKVTIEHTVHFEDAP